MSKLWYCIVSRAYKVLLLIAEFKLHSAGLWCFSSPVTSIKFLNFAVGWVKAAGNLILHHCRLVSGKVPLVQQYGETSITYSAKMKEGYGMHLRPQKQF